MRKAIWRKVTIGDLIHFFVDCFIPDEYSFRFKFDNFFGFLRCFVTGKKVFDTVEWVDFNREEYDKEVAEIFKKNMIFDDVD